MISAEPKWIAPYVVGRDRFTYEGEEYEYLVLSATIQKTGVPALCVMFHSGAMAISEKYPVEFRELGLIHEIMESVHNPIPENACVECLKRELALAEVRGIDMPAYVKFRTIFFSGLIDYYEQKPARKPIEDELLIRLRHSFDYLRQLRP